MIGKRSPQTNLFDVGNVFDLDLKPSSFHAQLTQVAPRLFDDADFAEFYHQRRGRPSVSPAQLALLTLLQHHAGCADEEAVERSAYDLRWVAVLRRPAGQPLCAKSTLQLFRSHLVIHDAVRRIFDASIREARRSGLLRRGTLRVAVDTKPILGRGAVEDTYNLLATGIRQLLQALAAAAQQPPEQWAGEHGLSRYLAPSLKGSVELDWSDPEARQRLLTEIVADARRLLRLSGEVRTNSDPARLESAARLLEQLLLQDVVETPAPVPTPAPKPPFSAEAPPPEPPPEPPSEPPVEPAPEPPAAQLKDGVTRDRMPSATDPDQRHGRKSKSQRFTGHKARIAVDIDNQLILDAEVLPGHAGDAEGLLDQVEQVEATTGQQVASTVGDCAYGSGRTRQEFADAGRELIAKTPQANKNGGRFPKRAFLINLEVNEVTCPAGQISRRFRQHGRGGKLFSFGEACGDCRLRAQCTRSPQGRQIRVHPQEKLLQEAGAAQQTTAGRAALGERVVVEHRLARLGQLGIGQARYRGREKTGVQLLLAATVANLRRTWNWAAAGGGKRGQKSPLGALQGGKRALTTLRRSLSRLGSRWGRRWAVLTALGSWSSALGLGSAIGGSNADQGRQIPAFRPGFYFPRPPSAASGARCFGWSW